MIAFSLLFSWYFFVFVCSHTSGSACSLSSYSIATHLADFLPSASVVPQSVPFVEFLLWCVCVSATAAIESLFSLSTQPICQFPLRHTHTHTTDKLFDSEEKTVRQGMIALARVTDDSQNKGAERAAATAATVEEIYAN